MSKKETMLDKTNKINGKRKVIAECSTRELTMFLFGEEVANKRNEEEVLSLAHALHSHRFSDSNNMSVSSSMALDCLISGLEFNAEGDRPGNLDRLFKKYIESITTGEALELRRELLNNDSEKVVQSLLKCIGANELVSMIDDMYEEYHSK